MFVGMMEMAWKWFIYKMSPCDCPKVVWRRKRREQISGPNEIKYRIVRSYCTYNDNIKKKKREKKEKKTNKNFSQKIEIQLNKI